MPYRACMRCARDAPNDQHMQQIWLVEPDFASGRDQCLAHDAGQQHLGWHVAVLEISDTSLLRAQHARMHAIGSGQRQLLNL